VSGGARLAALTPDWGVPAVVRAAFTLRAGGVRTGPHQSLNVAAHVGDAPEAVAENRRRIGAGLGLPGEPAWLEQVHGIDVIELGGPQAAPRSAHAADGVMTRRAGQVCVIQVADCLPVLLAARDGSAVAAAHAGWRGLAAGILEATVGRLGVDAGSLVAWLGPAIGVRHFEVGAEVRAAFLAHDPGADTAFSPNRRGRWQCDLVALARRRLHALGVREISGGEWCTYSDPERFFSYRRERQCGRMAALVWLT